MTIRKSVFEGFMLKEVDWLELASKKNRRTIGDQENHLEPHLLFKFIC